jgi:hypothetical protein
MIAASSPAGPNPAAGAPGTTPWGVAPSSLLPAVRRAMAGAPDSVAILLPPLPAARRRAARLILHDATRLGPASLLETEAGELLVLGAPPPGLDPLRAALDPLNLGAGARVWALGEAPADLIAWAATAQPLRPDAAPAAPASAASDEALLREATVRRTILRLGPGEASGRVAVHHAISRRRLAARIDPACAADPDRLEALAGALAARLPAAPPAATEAAAASIPALRPVPWPRPAPAGHAGDAAAVAAPAGTLALLPLAACADPAGLAAALADLAGQGWRLGGFGGLDADALGLIDPAGLPAAGLLLLRWSPALGDRAPLAALRGIAPDRLVLTGCDAVSTAIAWGLDHGIRRFAGPAVEALIDAARRPPAAGATGHHR